MMSKNAPTAASCPAKLPVMDFHHTKKQPILDYYDPEWAAQKRRSISR
jgi:hypothetical protein